MSGSVYDEYLPKAFPWKVRLYKEQVTARVNALVRWPREGAASDGSSFAVTADAQPGFLYLWLSDASAKFLVESEWLQQRDLEPQGWRFQREREEEF